MLPLLLYCNVVVRSFFYNAVPSVIEDWTTCFHLLGGALPSSCKGLCGWSVCESVHPLKTHLCAESAAGFRRHEWREAHRSGLEAALLGIAVGSSSSWESSWACLLFNCDLYAETDRFPLLTGLPAGLLTCSGYFQPMNLLMKMTFT